MDTPENTVGMNNDPTTVSPARRRIAATGLAHPHDRGRRPTHYLRRHVIDRCGGQVLGLRVRTKIR